MPRIPFKRFVPRIGGTLISVTIFAIGAIFFIEDKKIITYISANIVVTELLSIVYDSYYPRPVIIETPTYILPITNDVPITNEKLSSNLLSTQKRSHNMWFKISVVFGLIILFILMGSTWEMPFAIWSFFISFEYYHAFNYLYNEFFPSNSIIIDWVMGEPLKCTRNWSRKKIIFVTLCIDIFQFLYFWVSCLLSLSITIPGILDIIYNYCENILKSEVEITSLLYKITNFIIKIFDNYSDYIMISTQLICIRVLRYFLD